MVDLSSSISYNSFLVEQCPGGGMADTLRLGRSTERCGSSSLPWGTKIFRKLAQLVEHLAYTENVIGSNPVLPTII